MPDAAHGRETRFLPAEIIRRKRDGSPLDPAEIADFIAGFARGTVSGEQAAAFAMAVFWRGMDRAETAALTRAMVRTGAVLDWRSMALPGPVLDKHSTGGVGDNVSLILAPALAACGAFVPMISGRGLGHGGGTLDKLEALPGYRTALDLETLRRVVREVGCAIVGATAELAPADAKLYAIRDVTATVESVPLITASILSKKLAAGLDALVMDVKAGSGAFMASLEDARHLARSLVEVSAEAGLPTVALVTDMDEPLAHAAGNAVEVRAALAELTGVSRDPRLRTVTSALGSALLVLGGIASDEADGIHRIGSAIASGAAAEKFGRMVRALGGPGDVLSRFYRLPEAPVRRSVDASRDGFVERIDTRAVGLAVVSLGGGRTRPGEPVDPRVGFSDLAGVGGHVGRGGSPLGIVHAASEGDAEAAGAALRAAYRIAVTASAAPQSPILARVPPGIPQ